VPRSPMPFLYASYSGVPGRGGTPFGTPRPFWNHIDELADVGLIRTARGERRPKKQQRNKTDHGVGQPQNN
jgi:hypothetical protein